MTFQTFFRDCYSCGLVSLCAVQQRTVQTREFGKFRSQWSKFNCHGMIFMIISITTIGHKLASLWDLS